MRLLRRRRTTGSPAIGHETLGVSGVRFVAESDAPAADAAAREALRRIVDEAVMLQGLSEDIVDGIRQRRSLAELAPPGGALISRFVALSEAVPEPGTARLRESAAALRELLDHHALMLSSSLALLGDLRPERVDEQIDRLDGLGPPARRLCALQEQLAAGDPPAYRA
jgi:hypothetical protein